MSVADEPSPARTTAVPEPLNLVNWPLFDDRRSAAITVSVGTAATVFAAAVADSRVMGLFMAVAFATSVWRTWIPVSFRFDSKGIHQTVWKREWRLAWRDIAGYRCYPGGILFLPGVNPPLLAALRSVFVAWHGQRDELLEVVGFYLDREAGGDPVSTESHAH